MEFEDLLVVFICLLFSVERSKEVLAWCYAVGVSMTLRGDEECVSNTIFEFLLDVGGAATFSQGGRAILEKNRQSQWGFDPTKGYAGQDVPAGLAES